MWVDKGDPEDKMYRGAQNTTENITPYLCPHDLTLNLKRYRGEISKIRRLDEKTEAILQGMWEEPKENKLRFGVERWQCYFF